MRKNYARFSKNQNHANVNEKHVKRKFQKRLEN